MQLLILILKKVELMDSLLKGLAEAGVRGGTILDGTGMAGSLAEMEDEPIFGMLRHILSDEARELSKVMLFAATEEEAAEARKVIRLVTGGLDEPNTGIMFTVPITNVEGMRG